MSKNMKDVLQDELLFLSFVCNCTQRDWYFELLNDSTVELYTYNRIGVKVSHTIECDEERHVLLVKNTNGVILYRSDAMSLVSVAQWFCTERAPQLLLPAEHADLEMLERVLHGAYRIERDDSDFDLFSEVKDVLIASGMIVDGEIYIPSFNTRAIDSAEDCYKLLAWLNTRTVNADSNGNFVLDWMIKVFNEMYSVDSAKYVKGLFNREDDINVAISNNKGDWYLLVDSSRDTVTSTKLVIFKTISGSGLNLKSTPVYREPYKFTVQKKKTLDSDEQKSGTEEPKKSVLDDEFKKTDDLIDEVYDILYAAVVKLKVDTSSLPAKINKLDQNRNFYINNVEMDERCSTYASKINTLLQEYEFYEQRGLLETTEELDLPTKEQARQSNVYDTVDSDGEVPDLPTKEQARQSNDFDEVAENPVHQRVQDLIDGEVTSVDVRRLVYNGRTIAYRFKTNLGYYDMSTEAADKYGLSEGSVHFDKGILVDLKNGLFLTQREIREKRLVREVSNSEVCCEKLVNAVFTL